MTRIVDCFDVPEVVPQGQAIRLLPKNADKVSYWQRVDRNLGWITKEEQQILLTKVVGIAGCGGMGGMLAQILFRMGIGEVRIADPEVFDPSNLNRQFAATKSTVGKSKALETARATRAILEDGTLVVYPQGVSEGSVEDFLQGCNIVLDEIEFFAVAARILLHLEARKQNLTVLNCNTVGFGTRLFKFTPHSVTMEDCLGFTYEEALVLQAGCQGPEPNPELKKRVIDAVLTGLVPEIPAYREDGEDKNMLVKRLVEEGRASIISTNPPMATGFLADHVLLQLLKGSNVKRKNVEPPAMPGYLYFDAATMTAKLVEKKWW